MSPRTIRVTTPVASPLRRSLWGNPEPCWPTRTWPSGGRGQRPAFTRWQVRPRGAGDLLCDGDASHPVRCVGSVVGAAMPNRCSKTRTAVLRRHSARPASPRQCRTLDAGAVSVQEMVFSRRHPYDASHMPHIDSLFPHDLAQHALVSLQPARRLIVFIHGWRGDATETWGEFVDPPAEDWWDEADLLFVQYDSTAETVLATADRVRERFRDFYPTPSELMVVCEGYAVREDWQRPYDELVLVGHSLGGLVARRVVVDALDEWKSEGYAPDKRAGILDARLRLFSPASGGFLPRGILGALNAAPLWWVVEMFLRRGGAYLDMQPGSETLRTTQAYTEAYGVGDPNASALAASLLWANPEKVVATVRYATDARTRTADGTDHRSVCKPTDEYDLPYRFVRTGQLE